MGTPNPYGYQHRQARKRLLPKAYGTPCPLCGLVMLKGQALDLDHSLPLILGGVVGDRITHAQCNRGAGGRLARSRERQRPASQDW